MAKGTLNNLVYRLAAGIECTNCGSTHARCQLHHRDPATKLFDPSSRPPGTNLGKLLAEIMKCVPLCGRCHMDHHNGAPPKREWVGAKIDWELIGIYLATRGKVDRYSADYIETGVFSVVLQHIPLQYHTQIVML